jgi:hypothetical protein
MKNYILVVAFLIGACTNGTAQMALSHHFAKPWGTEIQIVNLALSGKKIMTVFNTNSINQPDTLYFYNMDYSFWKSIPCPGIPGYRGNFNIFHDLGQDVGIFYPSETLYNLDTFLEVGIMYLSASGGKFYVINEAGTLADSIVGLVQNFYPFRVYKVDTLGIGLQAVVSTLTGVSVYDMPGYLPCEACDYSLSYGIALNTLNQSRNGFPTMPSPNPSSNQVKITFKLPDGISKGELILYSSSGQKIKSYAVDNRFGYIMLDNTALPSGLYYYNIVTNGQISETQKLVLVK